jgi:hypothetical protein
VVSSGYIAVFDDRSTARRARPAAFVIELRTTYASDTCFKQRRLSWLRAHFDRVDVHRDRVQPTT